MKKVRWWTMAVLVFTCMFAVLIDIWLFLNDETSTISAAIIQYTGASEGSYRSAIAGFVFGSLMTHFTKWGRDADQEKMQ